MQVNQTVQLTATVALEPGAAGTPTIEWSSADEAKAAVSGNGTTATVTGKATGDVLIKAKATLGTSSAEGTTTVHVTAPPQPIQVRVQVNGAGTGSGQVTSTGIPGGDISCTISNGNTSGTCQAHFTDSDGKGSVTLTAAGTSGSTFGSWSGCGAGSSGTTCVLPYDATSDVTLTATARFEAAGTPPILGADEVIAFNNDPDGDGGPQPAQIWVMTNTSAVAITSGPGINTQPTWSPDGTRLAFRTKRAEPNGDIWTMNANGSGAALLTGSNDFDHDPDWSSTNRVAWVSDRSGNDEIYVIDVNDPTNVTNLTGTPVDEIEPKWSPDGSRIAYTVDDNSGVTRIFVMNADGTGKTPLTDGNADEEASWSPDGTRLVFTRNNRIWMINADGTGLTQVTFGGNDGGAVFSPDGTMIAFIRGPGNSRQIYVRFLGSGLEQQLGPTLPGESEHLDWLRKP